jgi:hypothetical protein
MAIPLQRLLVFGRLQTIFMLAAARPQEPRSRLNARNAEKW